jgi:hypothetical protein
VIVIKAPAGNIGYISYVISLGRIIDSAKETKQQNRRLNDIIYNRCAAIGSTTLLITPHNPYPRRNLHKKPKYFPAGIPEKHLLGEFT